ncbi:DUF58 domain-containing protein, partial [bacterium]|nr:DUF58 domain-containing protein [bacterium]
MIEIRKTFLLTICLLLGSLAGIYLTTPQQGQLFFRLIIFCALLLITSWFWAFISTGGFILNRSTRGLRHGVGQVFEERFEIINLRRFSRPWLEVLDKSNLPGSKGSRVLSWIGAGARRSYSTYTLLTRRGIYLLGPTRLSSGDPFGVFRYSLEYPGTESLLVLPYSVEINRFPFPAGLLPGGRAKRQKTYEITPHAASVREYVHGDPISRIHWPSSARRDRLISKEFEQDPLADVWIILDAQKKVHHFQKENNENQVENSFWLNQIGIMQSAQKFRLQADTFEYSVSAAA